MEIQDKSDLRLTLSDNQKDKAAGIYLLSAVSFVGAAIFAYEGAWTFVFLFLLVIPIGLVYLKVSRIKSTIILDREADKIELTVSGGKHASCWNWKLSDLDTAVVSETKDSDISGGFKRPDMIMKDGTVVPMRPHHSAGTQSWHTVAAVKLFLNQPLNEAPAGWIPPSEFDTFFADEMARLYKK
ncbi:hypothetical protein ABVF61_26645 [Roseibium sp. HPY-6]|uniref:hypothetical protein n=1 Tax=Roseibium sp. HPY-6 TaxID=3229852 RepID=UPI00338F57E8